MIWIDEEMLSWYYSILESNEEYAAATGSTFSADVAQLVVYTTEVRHLVTGTQRSDFDSRVIDRAWEEYDQIVERAIAPTHVFKYVLPQYRPVISAGQQMARWVADGMKYGMQLTGYDERVVRDWKEEHHINA